MARFTTWHQAVKMARYQLQQGQTAQAQKTLDLAAAADWIVAHKCGPVYAGIAHCATYSQALDIAVSVQTIAAPGIEVVIYRDCPDTSKDTDILKDCPMSVQSHQALLDQYRTMAG